MVIEDKSGSEVYHVTLDHPAVAGAKHDQVVTRKKFSWARKDLIHELMSKFHVFHVKKPYSEEVRSLLTHISHS